MQEDNLPDFQGKLVVLYLSDAPKSIQDGVLLEYASFQRYGGRLFVVGRVPEIEGESMDWIANLQGGAAWDSVTFYLLFNSREEYLNRVSTVRPPFWRRFFE
ncbi:MAG: hypothetical protein JRH13_08185 [Deltaproteobacteria bacterium]|nr:hypothetical protein [Deltaproteobacteria bacterium]MBW2016565.1 hypothetical protein [Deltaproteobacteria bacterium]MBW2129330.1 hypothetical protein [Deltaproteobacteria bacterium]MBW2303291.1 hypothetical protein [Deltaproteobacteria bacterium]